MKRESQTYLNDFIEEFSTDGQLENDEQVLFRINDVLHSNDGGMIDGPQDVNLVQCGVAGPIRQ